MARAAGRTNRETHNRQRDVSEGFTKVRVSHRKNISINKSFLLFLMERIAGGGEVDPASCLFFLKQDKALKDIACDFASL